MYRSLWTGKYTRILLLSRDLKSVTYFTVQQKASLIFFLFYFYYITATTTALAWGTWDKRFSHYYRFIHSFDIPKSIQSLLCYIPDPWLGSVQQWTNHGSCPQDLPDHCKPWYSVVLSFKVWENDRSHSRKGPLCLLLLKAAPQSGPNYCCRWFISSMIYTDYI